MPLIKSAQKHNIMQPDFFPTDPPSRRYKSPIQSSYSQKDNGSGALKPPENGKQPYNTSASHGQLPPAETPIKSKNVAADSLKFNSERQDEQTKHKEDYLPSVAQLPAISRP